MVSMDQLTELLSRLNPRLVARIEKHLRKLPAVRAKIEQDTGELMKTLESELKPYRDELPNTREIPLEGQDPDVIMDSMAALQTRETDGWKDGYVSGAVYHGDTAHIDFLNQVYALHSQTNPLHADVWPSISKYEAEIVAMTAGMLGGEKAGRGDLRHPFLRGHREHHAGHENLSRPGPRRTRHPPAGDGRADNGPCRFRQGRPVFRHQDGAHPGRSKLPRRRRAAARAITRRTVVIVGSAPSFPHGIVDPIAELSELARQRGIGFHTDACLGGFVLPWAEDLGYPVPPFDFRLPGVTSMSADTHKYGYAAKGTSVVLYRGPELRRYQYFTITDWPGGLYFSPTFAGSRPGALSAACWAAMVSIGQAGYLDATRRILETADFIKTAIRTIPELFILGDPLWVIAFGSRTLDIYRVMDAMRHRGWSLNGLHRPSCVHLCVTLRHTQPGVDERFVEDLQAAVAEVKNAPAAEGGMAPVYGMAATLPLRGVVSNILKAYMDVLYKT